MAILLSQADLDKALGPMPAADLPVALLPVRLETRYVRHPQGVELLVRIYPDDIHIDTHEPALTADEQTWGQAFWAQTWRVGMGDDEATSTRRRQAWAQLAQRFGAERAAWIAWTLQPTNAADRPAQAIDDAATLPVAPHFPERARRAESWTRPPLARALPDRWVLMGYRGGQRVLLALGEPIPADLAAGPDPSAPPLPKDDERLPLDTGVAWLVDFATAEKVGMALRIALTVDQAQLGFDTLLALGLRASAAETAGVATLEDLLLAQLYTAGLAFVPQQTPTNNSDKADAGFSPRDPSTGEILPPLAPAAPPAGSDGATTARLLGLTPSLVGRLAHANASENQDARAMLTALWPAMGGYFLEQMLADTFAPTAIDAARRHSLSYVRARGPLPALRVGAQPYGLLPVSSLDRWRSREGEDQFLVAMRGLRDHLLAAVPHVPRVDRRAGGDGEAAIFEVLRGDAVSSSYSARLLFDQRLFATPELHRNPPPFVPLEQRRQQLRQFFDSLGLAWTPRLLDTVLAAASFPLAAAPAQIGILAEDAALDPNYIAWLRAASYAALRDQQGLPGEPPNTLLYLLLRHALLLAYAGTAFRIQLAAGATSPADLREPAVVDLIRPPNRTTGRHPDRGLPGMGNKPLHTLGAADHPAAAPLDELRAALDHLQGLPATALEPLLAETIDLFGYRLDAWITSLATRRLDRMRNSRPRGLLLGGFGWVEGLQPAPPRQETPAPAGESGPLGVDPASAGFIHAPSLSQAATASILRSGYLSLQEAGGGPFAVDLSSRRARLAEWLLDGVRQGQQLGALLGYRFERGLHDHGLDRFIAPFRRIAPFGDLLKAQVAMEQTKAEAERLRKLPHPDLPAAIQASAAARSRQTALQNEQAALPSRIASAQNDLNRITPQITKINADIQRIGNLIIRFRSMHPPRETDQLDEQMLDLTQQRAGLQQDLATARQRLNTATARQQQIGAEIAAAAAALAQAVRREAELRRLPHPGLAAAEQDVAATEATYKELLERHRREFLFPNGTSQQALENIAADTVVDGLALLRQYQAGDLNFGQAGLPPPNSPDQVALRAELDTLAETVDAVGDALTAESVFQLVLGRPDRAGASLDSVASGSVPPPDLEVLRTPRRGTAITHRLLAVFAPGGQAQTWPGIQNPRALAEPLLNAWAVRLLGDPSRVRFGVSYLDPVTGDEMQRRELSLRDLQLGPLDLLALSLPGTDGKYADLERLAIHYLRAGRPANVPEQAVIMLDRSVQTPPGTLGLTELLDLAHTAARLVSAARPLTDADLAPPEQTASVSADSADMRARADTAETSFRQAATALSDAISEPAAPQALADALARLALFGIAEAIPGVGEGEDLPAQARSVVRGLADRLAALDAAAQVDRVGMTPVALLEHEQKRLKAIFGADFRVLPRLQPAGGAELVRAFAASAELQGGDLFAAANWLTSMARLRAGAGRLSTLLDYDELLNGTPPAIQVGQFPVQASARWCALAPPEGMQTPAGALSLVTYADQPITPTAPFAGLWIDEWIEVIPAPDLNTGLAFNFDEPAAQAAQAILLAVPPDLDAPWSLATLEVIALEAISLSKLRAVGPETMAAHTDLGQIFPALYFGLNLNNDTVSTDFRQAAKA